MSNDNPETGSQRQSDPVVPEVWPLIKYREEDPLSDYSLEYSEFRKIPLEAARQLLQMVESDATPQRDLLSFYSESDLFLMILLRSQIHLPHLLHRVRFARAMIDGLEKAKEGLDIIDIGAGLGNACIALHKLGHRCTYADVPGVIMDFARARFAARNCYIHMCDVTRLPERRYDVVMSFDVLEHLENPIESMVNFALHTQKGGILILTVDFLNFGVQYHLRKNAVYSLIFETILELLGFELFWSNNFRPVESVLKGYPRVYRLNMVRDDKMAMIKEAQQIAKKHIFEYQGYIFEELKHLEMQAGKSQ